MWLPHTAKVWFTQWALDAFQANRKAVSVKQLLKVDRLIDGVPTSGNTSQGPFEKIVTVEYTL